MQSLTIIIPFLPLSKSNSYRHKGGRVFVQAKVLAQEKEIARLTREAIEAQGWNLVEKGAIHLCLTFNYNDKRRRDLDGHLKALLDSMNGLVYKDDSQIVEIFARKIFVPTTLPATTHILITSDVELWAEVQHPKTDSDWSSVDLKEFANPYLNEQ